MCMLSRYTHTFPSCHTYLITQLGTLSHTIIKLSHNFSYFHTPKTATDHSYSYTQYHTATHCRTQPKYSHNPMYTVSHIITQPHTISHMFWNIYTHPFTLPNMFTQEHKFWQSHMFAHCHTPSDTSTLYHTVVTHALPCPHTLSHCPNPSILATHYHTATHLFKQLNFQTDKHILAEPVTL